MELELLQAPAVPVLYCRVYWPQTNCVPHVLPQYHFHTPSEHALNGKRFAMEVHLVHRNVNSGRWTMLFHI